MKRSIFSGKAGKCEDLVEQVEKLNFVIFVKTDRTRLLTMVHLDFGSGSYMSCLLVGC